MPRFAYKAYDVQGRLHDDETVAETRQAALDALHRQGMTVIDLIDAATAPSQTQGQRASSRLRVPRTALMQLTRDLATLAAADMPVEEALRLLASEATLPRAARLLAADVQSRVVTGVALSDAFGVHADQLPATYVPALAAAERGATQATTLLALALDLEDDIKLRADLRAALAYPTTLVIAALLTLGLVVGVLVPALAPLFEEAGAAPPWLIGTLDAMRRAVLALGWWGVIGAGVGGMALLAAARSPGAAVGRDRMLQRLPLIGALLRHRDSSRFTGTLAMLMQSGVGQLDAIRLAGRTTRSVAFRLAAEQAESTVANGGALSVALERSGLFSPLTVRLAAIGEQTGQIESMLERARRIEDAALKRKLETVTTLIGPLMTVAIGLIVGAIVLSIMSAIVGLNDLVLR